jgi:hypothetical protein
MTMKRQLMAMTGWLLAAGLAAAQPPAPAAPFPPITPEPPAPVPGPEPWAALSAWAAQEIAPFAAQVAVQATQAAQAAQAAQGAQIKVETRLSQRGFYGSSGDDRLYGSGQRALDRSQWDQALSNFSQVADHAGARADGALYWKAYALNKLGKRDEAAAAIADLRKSYPKSRWLDDANALEVQVKQSAGQNVPPEGQPDEEMKLMALNALVNSDPDRALPLLENLLKSSQTPRVKERALFVLAQSNSPRAQQVLEQFARGGGNPDLQLTAINYLGIQGRKQGNTQFLLDVYTAATDDGVKRAILRAFMVAGDNDHLLQAVKSEKSPQLRAEGIRMLGMKAENNDALTGMWTGEQDKQVKRAIMDTLSAQRNAKGLVDLARKETDMQLKLEIVTRLSTMKNSKEAQDYLMELLK